MPTTILIGEGALAVHCLDVLARHGLNPALVCSFDGSLVQPCEARGLPHVDTRAAVSAWLDEHGCDLLLSVRNPWLLPASVLGAVRQRAVNFHDSPLPRYAGLHATSWALLHGEREHGISWHEITTGVDEGRLLCQVKVPIAADDTALTLNTKCYEAAASAFEGVAAALAAGTEVLTPQQGEGSYFSGKDRPAAQCVIELDGPAAAVVDLVRALDFGHAPNPLGRAKLWLPEGPRLVRAAVALPTPSTAAPGTLLACDGGTLRIATRTVDVELSGLADRDGRPLDEAQVHAAFAGWCGRVLPALDAEARARLTDLDRRFCRRERAWVGRLTAGVTPVEHPYVPAEGWGPLRAAGLPQLGEVLG
ncbi:MAG: hypothetical protein KDK70_30430, partial [Myxococcales bacterium]|nr:hypothetical protein [Myxococcales bacterium]